MAGTFDINVFMKLHDRFTGPARRMMATLKQMENQMKRMNATAQAMANAPALGGFQKMARGYSAYGTGHGPRGARFSKRRQQFGQPLAAGATETVTRANQLCQRQMAGRAARLPGIFRRVLTKTRCSKAPSCSTSRRPGQRKWAPGC